MPLLLAHQTPLMGIWKIEEPWQTMLERFENKALFEEDVHQIQSDKRKQEWLAVRLLVKHLTGSELLIEYGENGAPFLLYSYYNISISHTTGYAAVILSKSPRPGIDIEYRSERAWKLRERFMSEKELILPCEINLTRTSAIEPIWSSVPHESSSVANNPLSDDQATLATLCWCAKETVFKALHETEVDFINHLHIAPFTLYETGAFSLKETKTNQQNTYIVYYWITDDFVVTWIF
jgi:phosphopantetheinyl transferase